MARAERQANEPPSPAVRPFDLAGLRALVTGGNSGIGLGMARGLARAGAAVAVVGRDPVKNQRALDELGPLTGPLRVRDDESPLPDPRALLLNPHERKVYDLLDSVPKDIDLLTRESGLSAANAASILMVLELRHLAVQMPGKLYVRAGTLRR